MDRFTFAQKYLTDNWKRAAGWVFFGSPILIAALFNYKREPKSLILLASIGLTFFASTFLYRREIWWILEPDCKFVHSFQYLWTTDGC